jgi:hypothetical protein
MKVDQRPSFDIAKGIPDGGIFVEIGTWEGGFSDVLLGQTGCKKLYCVDPYKHFTAGEYPDGMNQLTQTMFDTKYEKTRQRMEKYGDRVEFIRKESCEAALLFDDHSVDYVYIDGNHDYKYVLADIRAWYPKIRPGGWLCGDDVYSQNLAEHDTDGNVLRIWSPGCWGKYGTYKAIVDSGLHFRIVMTQFIVQKV